MTNPDWYYDQGAPDPDQETPDICTACEYTNCQCDAAYDYDKDNR